MISKLWLKMSFIFNPVQRLFNGNFWQVFRSKFQSFTTTAVIDLACGTGELRRYINPQKYLGVDINTSHVSFAEKRFQNYHETRFIAEDIIAFSIPKDYDTAFLISAVHHLSDQQINQLCQKIKNSKTKNFIIIDGIPKGMFSPLLRWLDKVLAGGEYFRDKNRLVKIADKYFTIVEHGTFSVAFSLYNYPYVVAKI